MDDTLFIKHLYSLSKEELIDMVMNLHKDLEIAVSNNTYSTARLLSSGAVKPAT